MQNYNQYGGLFGLKSRKSQKYSNKNTNTKLSSIKFIKDIQATSLKKTRRGARVYGVKRRKSKRRTY